jgi:hypothetical protein
MKELASIARNFGLTESDDGLIPMVELVLTVSEPKYEPDDSGRMMRRRRYETLRIGMQRRSLRFLMDDLADIDTRMEEMEKLIGIIRPPAESTVDTSKEGA